MQTKTKIADAAGLVESMEQLRKAIPSTNSYSFKDICDRLDVMIWGITVLMAQNAELLRAENEK